MSEKTPPTTRSTSLANLREQATWLANDLAGPLRRLSLQSGDVVIEVEWQPQTDPAGTQPAGTQPVDAGPAKARPADQEADGHIVICSPIVGTLYRAPSPDAAPFVEVGDPVEAGQTVAIVEAMKLFNPIVAEQPGIVTEVLVANGQQVQFGEPLLRLKAAPPATPAGPSGRKE
jgi:acetyl-CoA carboxylase biotin carboxyl carrier protein